jgi:hypothetical protein
LNDVDSVSFRYSAVNLDLFSKFREFLSQFNQPVFAVTVSSALATDAGTNENYTGGCEHKRCAKEQIVSHTYKQPDTDLIPDQVVSGTCGEKQQKDAGSDQSASYGLVVIQHLTFFADLLLELVDTTATLKSGTALSKAIWELRSRISFHSSLWWDPI